MTGEVHAAGDGWRPVLARLLPHYIGDSRAGPVEELSGEARSVFRRFLHTVLGRRPPAPADPLLAVYHWSKWGTERLYVHRIGSTGTKEELGWVDLKTRAASSTGPGAGPILAYCRTAYQRAMAS